MPRPTKKVKKQTMILSYSHLAARFLQKGGAANSDDREHIPPDRHHSRPAFVQSVRKKRRDTSDYTDDRKGASEVLQYPPAATELLLVAHLCEAIFVCIEDVLLLDLARAAEEA
ncbi:hypothetical protein MRB53_037085 [Persea americana]|nr:hypothetical protein MRB53_037085 [Persea americana]